MLDSMNGEIRIWDVRAPEKPLYENLAQPLGLAGLAVHTGAPILATYVLVSQQLIHNLERWKGWSEADGE